jgi:hypothetical protein
MKSISADSKDQLTSILRGIDISVPPRKEGRKTPHLETWSICHLLATLAQCNEIVYPMELTKRERPDFLPEYRDSGLTKKECTTKEKGVVMDDVILQAFDWRYADMADNAGKIAGLGYGAVLIPPLLYNLSDEPGKEWCNAINPKTIVFCVHILAVRPISKELLPLYTTRRACLC